MRRGIEIKLNLDPWGQCRFGKEWCEAESEVFQTSFYTLLQPVWYLLNDFKISFLLVYLLCMLDNNINFLMIPKNSLGKIPPQKIP